jgi:dienelactone hydrolase
MKRSRLPSPVSSLLLLATLLTASVVPLAAQGGIVGLTPLPPDPCSPNQIQIGWQPVVVDLEVLGGDIELYSDPEAASAKPGMRGKPLAVIVNGNGFGLDDYEDFASFLARRGFYAAVAHRPGGVDPADFVLEAIDVVLDEIGQSAAATPVGLIGHSVGGGVVIDAAVRNEEDGLGFDVQAVVGLAPQVGGVDTPLDIEHAPAFLAIYGSQDNDVEGLNSSPSDAFAAYDLAGTESSTTCHGNGLCFVTPGLDRTMIFVHGADHAGLVNQIPSCGIGGCEYPFNNYLSKANQFCIAKGYTEAFLRWTLADDAIYHNMVRGRWKPASINAMTTAAADELGNPAGTPVRIRFQSSPAKRSAVENLEDGAWVVASATPDVETQLFEAGDLIAGSANVRHQTKYLALGWPVDPTWQLIGFTVPASKRNTTGFSHVALRAGQLANLPPASMDNPANTSQSVMIGLHDGTHTSWKWLAPIPPNDERPDGKTHSVMSTFAVTLSSFSGIDKTKVESIYLAFPGGTQGTLIVDSFEWFKD